MRLFLLLWVGLVIFSCTDGIVLDPPKEFGQKTIGMPNTASKQTEKQTSSLNIIALIEDQLNFPYATHVLLGMAFVTIIWAVMSTIYRLTTSSPG